MWKLVRKGGKIVAAALYKITNGRKLVLAGSDGTAEGKKSLYDILSEDIRLKSRNTWAEVSEAMEHLYLNKLGGVPISNNLAEKVLAQSGKQITKLDDGYHYIRKIGNQPYVKIMVGNLPSKYSNL
jgi:hypothetical protein